MIDSDGAANSTIASLTVNKPVDYPPIANAGPNQAVTLPQNFITLNGNQSSDDHEIVSYEWSLSPKSKGKVVAMQVCVFLLAQDWKDLLSLPLTWADTYPSNCSEALKYLEWCYSFLFSSHMYSALTLDTTFNSFSWFFSFFGAKQTYLFPGGLERLQVHIFCPWTLEAVSQAPIFWGSGQTENWL